MMHELLRIPLDQALAEQQLKYSNAIAPGLPSDDVAKIADFAADATVKDFYKDHISMPFWFEMLEREGWQAKVGAIADSWAQSDSNIQRAAAQVNRPAKPPSDALVRAFGICRFKPLFDKEWARLPEGLGMDDLPQTVVCLALCNLGPHNGFFLNLPFGQDICIDGKDRLILPPSGGGIGLLVWIDL